MPAEVLFTFVAACVLLALTPGPNMALMIANTLASGLRAGLVTLAGTTTGLALLVTAAAAGMTSIMVFMAAWFDVVRWAGAVYLIYLGASQLWRLRRRGAQPDLDAAPVSGANRYLQGVIVSLSNPKVILFLGAFLPQFVDLRADPVGQLVVLAVLFVVVLAAVDVVTTFAVAKARKTFGPSRLRLLDGLSGGLLVLGGLALATMRRP
jgi:threonine/homoserine/homoserine lactone efflux protein